jgi:hypothetical protein
MTLVLDERLADRLEELTPTRCMVMAARAFYRGLQGPCTAPYECCACGMPTSVARGPCVACGRDNYRRLRREQEGAPTR